ncbi:hypothetical protein Syun_023551 [Stephania yunnanensis]|uniref:Uncharacterized protein n=1 Tax=Stephania yunnanensis TaxID=152371 RepID=A0AAP0FC96_9MAGN
MFRHNGRTYRSCTCLNTEHIDYVQSQKLNISIMFDLKRLYITNMFGEKAEHTLLQMKGELKDEDVVSKAQLGAFFGAMTIRTNAFHTMDCVNESPPLVKKTPPHLADGTPPSQLSSPGSFMRPHLVHSRIPPIPRPNRLALQLQISTVGSLFLLHSLIPLLPIPLPRSLPRLILSSAFAQEFLHFYLHRKDPSGLENRYFDLMLLPVSLCAVSALLRPDRAGGPARGVGLVMQGAWFMQMGFSFFTG